MIARMKQSWQDFEESKPGRRFRNRYYKRQQNRQSRLSPSRLFYMVGGVLLVVASIFLGPAPGFGFGTAFIGLALLASEFRFMAHLLDWSEVRLRSFGREARDVWRTLPLVFRAVIVLVALILTVALLYGLYKLFFG